LLTLVAVIAAMMLAEQARGAPDQDEASIASPPATPDASQTSTPAVLQAQEVSPTPHPTESGVSHRRAQLIEPVRPISPGPRTRSRPKGSASAKQPSSPKVIGSPGIPPPKKEAPASGPAVSANDIVDYDRYPVGIHKILDLALGLTNQNLVYKYGSADPANGGMDCSGFVYYVLLKSGVKDPPRDAREQYVWVRKAGNFQAVLGHNDDTFELDALTPGDLLFWGGTNTAAREPDIIYTMIYLGQDKETNRRLMIGASDGRTFNYKGQPRSGVSVFDFKVTRAPSKSEGAPVFVGYGRVPNLPND
jgi:cell wall-associated NlpC family hydrolase